MELIALPEWYQEFRLTDNECESQRSQISSTSRRTPKRPRKQEAQKWRGRQRYEEEYTSPRRQMLGILKFIMFCSYRRWSSRYSLFFIPFIGSYLDYKETEWNFQRLMFYLPGPVTTKILYYFMLGQIDDALAFRHQHVSLQWWTVTREDTLGYNTADTGTL